MNKYPSKLVENLLCKGKALSATKNLGIGVIVEKFEGPIIKYADVPKDMICHVIYAGAKKGDDKWIVSKTQAIFTNHSCNPNCMVDDGFNIITIKKIKKGEELTFSYNLLSDGEKASDFFWDARWNFKCRCNSKNCQKKIDKYV